MNVEIGSKYTGPILDRPSLRKLPAGWVLETEEPSLTKVEYGMYCFAALLGAWTILFTAWRFLGN